VAQMKSGAWFILYLYIILMHCITRVLFVIFIRRPFSPPSWKQQRQIENKTERISLPEKEEKKNQTVPQLSVRRSCPLFEKHQHFVTCLRKIKVRY
jgi:hypothetical protein